MDLRDGIGISYDYMFNGLISCDGQTHVVSESRREKILQLLKILNINGVEIKYGD